MRKTWNIATIESIIKREEVNWVLKWRHELSLTYINNKLKYDRVIDAFYEIWGLRKRAWGYALENARTGEDLLRK